MTIEKGKSYSKWRKFFRHLLFYHSAVLSVDGCCECDDYSGYACINGREGILNLRQHTATDSTVGLIFNKVRTRNSGDDTIIIIGIAEHTFLLK